MAGKLLNSSLKSLILLMFLITSSFSSVAQETVFSENFSTSLGSSYDVQNNPIGNSPTWNFLRSGTDFGARIHNGVLSVTNDATGASNQSGWGLAYTLSAISSPYSPILNTNPGIVSWTFNMRQPRSNPSGLGAGAYGNAFILAGTSNTTATTGSGYAVMLGNNGKTDPIRLIRYTAGLRTNSTILQSATGGLSDFGNQYLSIKVEYNPSNNEWELFVRSDGGSFQDPSTGNYVSQGFVTNSTSTATSLPLLGAFWNASTRKNQIALFDNIKVAVTTPQITAISPTSRTAGTAAFTLNVYGTDFTSASRIRWNGAIRTTEFVSSTYIRATIPATDITTAGTAAITVGTGNAVSNTEIFTIDPAGVPTIATSISSLTGFNTTTGTASANQNFTVTAANLTAGVSVTAPANYEVSTSAGSGFADQITLAQSGGTLTGQPVTVYTRLKSTAPAGIYTGSITLATTGGANKLVAVSGKVLATEPGTSTTQVTFANVGASSFTINFTPGSGTNRLVVVRQGSAVTNTPVDGTTYNPSTTFGLGADLGNSSHVVYTGTGSSVTVTGLTAATTYHVAVYEFNGAGGTQNYRTTSPGTGSRTTLNAPLGLQVTTANTAYNVNFDTTVDGVNNGTFTGAGVQSIPEDGELNSFSWAFTGFSDGAVNFGGGSPEDSAYDVGSSEGGVIDGGLYAFEVAPGNVAMGVQPAAGEFIPGSATFRFQNQTGATINSLSVGYKVYVYNDEPGSSSFNLSHSQSATGTFTAVNDVNHTTPAAADAVPGWKAYYKVVTITGLSIASNGYYHLRWSSDAVSGTAFDEIALDDISIVANPTTNFASFTGNAETFTVAGNGQLSGDVSVAGNIVFSNNSWLAIGANNLTLSGTVTNTSAGGIRGGATSSLTVNGSVDKTLSFNQATPGTTNQLSSFTVATAPANTITAENTFGIAGTLTIDVDQTLNMGTNALTGALSTILNNGTIATQNTTALPLPAGKTWGGDGTVLLNAASAAQTLVSGTYNDITVNTTGGATATGNVTVNGNLSLPQANPSATAGSLNLGANTLFMSPEAVNSGIGDVSGIVTRNTGIMPNMLYTFGHENTSILLPPVGTLPTSMSLKITLGEAPAAKPDAILRSYDFIQTGGSATKATISAHYLDSELNGNAENTLVDWVIVTSPLNLIEQGRSNYNTTENWVEQSNVNVAFFSNTFGNRTLTLASFQADVLVWNGSVSDSWTTAANWTPNASPSDETIIIIPDAETTDNDPILNPEVTIASLTIEDGGILNAPTGSEFTLTASTGAWINNGTFNPNDGVVTFTGADATIAGTTNFNDLTIATGALLRATTDNIMRIDGDFTKSGTLILGAVANTVEYTGTNQTIVVPDGGLTAYYNLTISGTGAVMPPALNISGNLTTNETVDFTATSITLNGVDNQIIGGTVSPELNNLTVNKPLGEAILNTDTAVNGTLTLTSGLLNIGNNDLTLGAAPVAGTFSVTSMIVADGDGEVRRPFTGTGSYFFPIGEKVSNTTYSPIDVEITSGTFNNAFVAVNVRDAVHPNNSSINAYMTRYWNVTQTGITDAIATITANYVTGDAVGGQENLSAAQLDGTFDLVTNPWVKYNTLSGNTLSAANALLTDGQTSVFTGITNQDVIVTVIGEGTFCEATEVTLTSEVSGGDAPYTYEWSDGLGDDATAVPPTDTPGTVTYTLTVRDANGIAATDTAQIVVTEQSVGGVAEGDQIICAGSTPEAVTLTGNTGAVVRWERSISLAFTNPAFINNTTTTLTGAEIGNITSTRYIRAVVQNGSCGVVYSEPVSIAVLSTTWDGAVWSNGEPDITTSAIFNADYTADTDINACTVIVTTGANVTIPSGFNVTINGAITVTGGTFILENNANLLQQTDVQNTGNIIVRKNSNPLYRLDYTLWSSPVTGQNLLDFSPNTVVTRFYTYNEATDEYAPIDPEYNNFETGEGYLIRMPNAYPNSGDTAGYNAGTTEVAFEGEFEGVPNNGDITVPLTTAGNGYNAVGNPYPSPINIHEFFDFNIAAIDQLSALYFWRKTNNPNETTYATITKLAYAANNAEGGDVGGDVFTGDPANWVINSGQGFIVEATGSTLLFNNDMRREVNNNQIFRTNEDETDISRLWLNITAAEGGFTQTAIGYTNITTLGFDYGWDGKSLNAESDGLVSLYSIADETNLSVQARAVFNVADVVPMGYRTDVAGNCTIALDHADGVFENGQDIFLKDNTAGITHDLKESAYTFTTEAGSFTDRFEVVYQNVTLGNENPVLDNNTVVVYKKDNVITINSGNVPMTGVTIYDVRGRLLYSRSGVNATETVINDLVSEQQVLIVNIAIEKGNVTRKIVY